MNPGPYAGASSSSLVLRNELSELTRVSSWVEEWARERGLPSCLAQHLDLCAAELVTNVIDHAHDDGAVHPINLSLRIEKNRISLDVEDDGKPFDPREVAMHPAPSCLDEAQVGGWGLAIVRHFADEFGYRRTEVGNRVTVVFRLG